VIMVVGLVLVTAATLAVGSTVRTVSDTRALIEQVRDAAVNIAAQEAHRFFETAPRITDELAAQARRGTLPLDHPDQLAAIFAERLRAEPKLAWIGYGE